MNNSNTSLGFYIPNSDYIFQAQKVLLGGDHVFIITKQNEIIVYQKVENPLNGISDLNRRFILFTHPQIRNPIFDIVVVNIDLGLLNHPCKKVIITISENLILNYWNLKDGLCINKINLSNYKRKGENLINVFILNERFIFILFTNKSILFDSRTGVVIKDEKFNFVIKSTYKVKENKFFLLTETNDTHFLELQYIPLNYRTTIDKEFNYEEIRYRVIKHTFHIDKIFNEETMYTLFSKGDFVFHNFNQTIKVSFLDSVEELTELSSMKTEYKFKIVYLDKINVNDEEFLIVVYKDLLCEIFTYDKKIREIKRSSKLIIMVEDEYLKMKYSVIDSILIGYIDSVVNIFDLKKNRRENEKYVDRSIELSNIFGKSSKKLFLTNYFIENFPEVCKEYIENINKNVVKFGRDYFNEKDDKKKSSTSDFKITASTIFSHPNNRSIYNIIGTNTGKVAMIDIFFNSTLIPSPIVIIDYHTSRIDSLNIYENKYLVISSEDGVITFTDISNENIIKSFELNTKRKQSSSNGVIGNFNYDNMNNNFINEQDKLNFYYSKRLSLCLDNKIEKEELSSNVINLLPIHTMKNYYKLKRILIVTQSDPITNVTLDENFKKKFKILLGFQLENNSILIIDMDTLKTIYRFNINTDKHNVKAIYHISYEKCLIVYLDDDSIRVCSYATKTADRIVTDINKIYNILRVEEKLRMYFIDPENILNSNFKTNYEVTQKQSKKENENENDSKINQYYINNNDYNSNNKTHDTKQSEHHPSNEISLNIIKESLTNEKQKRLFMEKYIHTVFHKLKANLNITLNRFEAVWIKKIESLIIDEIYNIINSLNMIEKQKKISIVNCIYNPTTYYKIFDRYEYNTYGIEGTILKIGNQTNEYLNLNIEDYFLYIEKLGHEGKNKDLISNVNYYNFISLFRIWNLSIDQDLNMWNFLKIYQPVFEFNFILGGCDSSLSLILTTEVETEGDLAGHFNFFSEFMKSEESQRKIMKTDKFCNKSYLVKSAQGYLTNFKNFNFSTNLSHFLNLCFYGSLIAVLGFEEMNDLCKAIAAEKSLMKNLAQGKFTLFTNLNIIDKFMFEFIDDITLSNKDILLNDYLNIKFNKSKSNTVIIDYNRDKHSFKDKISRIMNYLENLYEYIFNYDKEEEIYLNFYKLHKDKNVDPNKLTFLSEFELSIINLIIHYNSIVGEKDKFDECSMVKISQLLILFVFKILNPIYINFKSNFSKIVVELLSKCTEYLEKIYKDNMTNYAKFLIDLYTSIKVPIDLDGLFKKYEIGNCLIIKSEDNFNFIKIMLAKLLKNFSKSSISYILKIIVEEFKKKVSEYDYFSYLLEILWILFREKNSNNVNYLPPLINLIMTAMSMQNKEMRHVCLDNAKKVLSCLLPNYPMISFHQNSQKLAVGANDGKVYIYDLTSGNIWKNLNAHTNEITALSFDFTGNILISYSSTEKTVKFWKIGLTNFFSNFFSMKDGYYKSLKFGQIIDEIGPEDKISIVKFQLMPKNDNKIVLIREDKSVEVLPL